MIALIGRSSSVPIEIEEVKTIRLQSCMIVDGWVDLEEFPIHFEFAKVGRGISEPLQNRTHIGYIRSKIRDITKLHLIENAIHLGRLTTEEGGARRRTHSRGDVVVSEIDAVAFEFSASGQVVVASD